MSTRALAPRFVPGPLKAPPPTLGTPLGEPRIRPSGIRWRGGVGNRQLVVELALENPHPEWTRPTPATLRQAAFGAFQPWTPVQSLVVPPIAPGGRISLSMGGTLDARVDRRAVFEWAREARRSVTLAGEAPIEEAVHFVGNFDLLVGSQRVFRDPGLHVEIVEKSFDVSLAGDLICGRGHILDLGCQNLLD